MDALSDSDERREQFVALFVRHEAAIHSFVLTLLPDLNDAEDVVQQASLTLWRKFDQYTPGTSFRNWAFQVAKLTAMNHLTKTRRDRHCFQENLLDLLADRATERAEQLETQRRALAFCLDRLPEDNRQLLAGCYAEGSTIRGCAEKLGRTSNALYKHLNRLRANLLKCVELPARLGGGVMNDDRRDHTLRELVESVVNGDATTEQRAQLEQQLLSSEAARDFYLEYVNLHSALRRRYFTPEEDAVDLPAQLADFRRAVEAESRQVRRPRWRTATLLAMATGLALVLVAIYTWQRQTSSDVAREIATIQAVEGEATFVSAEASHTAQIGDTVQIGDTLRLGAEAARATLKYPDGTVVRLHSGSVIQSPANRDVRLHLLAGSIEVDAVKQPPNRPLVFATAHSRYVVLGTRFRLYHEQETSRLELDEGKVRMERPVSGEAVEILAGSVAIAADENTPVEILPLSSGQAELQKSLRDAGQKVAFSTDGDRLFTSHWEQGLKCWRVEDASLEHKYARDPGSSDALVATPEEQTVVQVNRNGYVLAWSPGQAEAMKLPLTGVQARSRAVSPEGQVVAESSVDGTLVYGLDLTAGKLSERFKHPDSGKAWCLALSSRGERLAAGFWDGTTRVYDVASSQVVFERKLLHTPTHVDLTADGQMLLVFTQRDGLRVIDLTTGEQRALWPPGSEMVRCVRFTSDGTRVIAGLNDRTARMWRVKDGRQLLVIEAGQSPQGIAWSEKHQMLATADGSVKMWKCRFDVAGSSD